MTQKINSESSNLLNQRVDIIDENYVISKKLIPDIEAWKIKFVLKQYGEKIAKRLLSGKSHIISIEKDAKHARRILMLRIKRSKSFLEPKPILTIESEKGEINNKKLNIEVLSTFETKLKEYPKTDIYKFPII